MPAIETGIFYLRLNTNLWPILLDHYIELSHMTMSFNLVLASLKIFLFAEDFRKFLIYT
jgi:hypothetical protein